MQSPQLSTLHTVCGRFGPGRLPKAEKPDIGAGYAAAAAAVVATVCYGLAVSIGAVVGMDGFGGMVNLAFAGFALPFVVPAAFLVGVIGWRYSPSYTPLTGVVGGGLGAILTYLVTMLFVGVVLTVSAVLSLSGADPTSAATFSIGLVAIAFTVTWWVTIPIGCLAGYLYVTAVDSET